MATKLNQMLAVRSGVTSAADSMYAQLKDRLSQRGRLAGLSRTYQPNVDGGHVYAPERTKVQVTVADALAQLDKTLTRLFDVVLTTERTNGIAVADLRVDGELIVPNVPATGFLFLERQLGKLREFVEDLPVLDEAEDWGQAGAPAGQWRSEPVKTDKTKKQPRNHVKWEPPDSSYTQQAQVETFAEDVPEGVWTLVKFSGAIPSAAKSAYLDKIAQLQEGAKLGREEANSTEVTDVHAGAAILAFVFG